MKSEETPERFGYSLSNVIYDVIIVVITWLIASNISTLILTLLEHSYSSDKIIFYGLLFIIDPTIIYPIFNELYGLLTSWQLVAIYLSPIIIYLVILFIIIYFKYRIDKRNHKRED